MLFIIIYRSKHELDEESNSIYFGFWYKGIRKRMWYFELMNICSKCLTIAGSIFFKSFALKIGVGLFFMLYLTDYVIKNKPMQLHSLNYLQIVSFFASYSIFLSGLLFEEISSLAFHIILFIVVIIINLIYWGLMVFFIVKKIKDKKFAST